VAGFCGFGACAGFCGFDSCVGGLSDLVSGFDLVGGVVFVGVDVVGFFCTTAGPFPPV